MIRRSTHDREGAPRSGRIPAPAPSGEALSGSAGQRAQGSRCFAIFELPKMYVTEQLGPIDDDGSSLSKSIRTLPDNQALDVIGSSENRLGTDEA